MAPGPPCTISTRSIVSSMRSNELESMKESEDMPYSGEPWIMFEKNGASPPPQFRVVRAAAEGVVSKPALCGSDEVMVSATCLSRTGAVNQAAKTLSDTGAACDPRPGESEIPEVVILCAKRDQ